MNLASLSLALSLTAVSSSAQTYRVFTMTNGSPNQVLMYTRATNGALSLTAATATGGNGNATFLASQGAVAAAGRFVFAVNSLSNSISVLHVGAGSLKLASTVPSNGTLPVSLTYSKGYLYVLNAGGSGTISGFAFNAASGTLTAIAGSTQPLSGMAASGGAQIGFTRNGAFLIVTEKNTNLIDVYKVTNGVAGPPATYPSNGPTPYGFATGASNRMYISEGNASVPFGSSVSSYSLSSRGVPSPISGSIPTNQSAACWVALNAANTIAYVTDAESAAVSVFTIDAGGHLALSQTVFTPGPPFDNAISSDGLYYYQLTSTSASHQIVIYGIAADGTLAQLFTTNGTSSAIGLVTLTM